MTPMENKRLHWLDAVRGVALTTTMWLHIMRWLLLAFASWSFTDSSFVNWQVGVVRFTEGYLRMSWLIPFAFAFAITISDNNYTIKWISKRFLLLFVLPTAIYSLLSFHEGFQTRWEVIQSLFFYNILGLLVITWSRNIRYLFYAGILAASIYMHYQGAELLASGSLFWKIMVGGLEEDNFFSIASGLPCFFLFFEQALVLYDRKTEVLNTRPLWVILFMALAAMIASWVIGFNQIEPRHYPPQFAEYLGSVIISNLTVILCYKYRSKITEFSFLSILGRYCWVHFIGHLALGTYVFEYLHLGNNKLEFIPAALIGLLVLLVLWKTNVAVLKYRQKRSGHGN